MNDLPDVPVDLAALEQVDGLSEYDMIRKPLALIEDSDVVEEVEIHRLLQEFKCPICLGVLRNTVTVMQCLHRFCSDCMERNLRSMSKKQCPACRIHVPSRRSLQRDYRVDALISKIIPNISKFERRRMKRMKQATAARTELAGVNKTWGMILEQQKAFRLKTGLRSPSAVVEEQMANAAAASIGSSRSPTSSKRSSPSRNSRGRAKRGRESKITATGTDTRAAATSTLALAAQRLGTPLRVVLCKHPLSTLNIFETTPLIVAPTCTIGVLRHFLAAHVLRQRGRQRKGADLEVLLTQPDQARVLDPSTLISSIHAPSDAASPLVLHVCAAKEVRHNK